MYIDHDLRKKRQQRNHLLEIIPRIIDSRLGAGLGARRIFFACLLNVGHLSV